MYNIQSKYYLRKHSSKQAHSTLFSALSAMSCTTISAIKNANTETACFGTNGYIIIKNQYISNK